MNECGDAGSARRARLAGRSARCSTSGASAGASRSRSSRPSCSTSGSPPAASRHRRRTATARSTLPARRSWTPPGRSSPTPCCHRCSARSPTGSPRDAPQRRRQPRRLVVHRRLVRLRREGSADAARARRPRARSRRGSAAPASLAACRDALWAALGAAAADLAKTQGADPTQWHADATAERINFTTGHPPRTRCAGRTGRRSSRSSASPATAAAGTRGVTTASRYALGVAGKRYLFTPGPTPVPPEVLAATAAPVIHHRGPDFKALLARDARAAAAGLPHRERRAPLHRVGNAARSSRPSRTSCSPGDRVLAVSQGEFGERWQKLAAAYGADVIAARRTSGERSPRRRGSRRERSRTRRPTSSSSCTPRPRPGSSPTSRRWLRSRKTPVRSSSSTRSRASAPSRSRPTPGASTSSSPARRRR